MRRITTIFGTLCLLLCSAAASAGDAYPSNPVQLIVPYPAGGGSDVLMRAYADAARKYTNGSIVIINKPGAIGTIGFDEGARARPDGYTVTMIAAELLIAPYVKMGKKTFESFDLIGRLNVDPAVVLVKAESPLRTAEDFAALARKKPGEVSLATGGYVFRVAMAGFEDKFGLRFNHVPYQGESPAIVGLMGDQVDAVVASPGAAAEFVRSGKLRILGVLSEARLPSFPQAPTFRERGFNFSAATWRGLAVPKGTPPNVVDALRQLTRKVSEDSGFRSVAAAQEIGLAYQDAEAFRGFLVSQDAELRAAVPKANLSN
jgi:tripartite-type tricarboxylate transporter receptor subunit TctC